MTQPLNHLGQPIGRALPHWSPPPHPPREALQGRLCRLEPLDPARHVEALYAANALDVEGRNWTYLPYGPFDSVDDYRSWIASVAPGIDPLFFAICRLPEGDPVGIASYLRIAPASGAIEIGHIHYSERLKHTIAATEAMFLMMKRSFDLGYRRCEWKCDALNAASRAAAQRLGFSYEGVFRQATVYKGHNRDTAWYAVIDTDWPALQKAFTQWLDPGNFDAQGKQRTHLRDLTAPLLKQAG